MRVWSVALHEVEQTPELLGTLNEINQRLLHARVYWAEKAVVFEDAVAGLALNKGVLRRRWSTSRRRAASSARS